MLLEKKQLEIMRSSTFSELKVHELDIFTNRIILQVEGPFSTVFWDERTKKREFGSIALAFEYYWISLSFLISNGEFIFFVLYYCFSVQGLIQSPVFYSFHLLDVINRFPALQNVILSVTTNINQLLMTAMLGIILIYIWACIAFLFIADNYFDDAIHTGLLNKAGDSVCMSLMHCFLSTINYGLRFGGGMGDFFPTVTVESWAWQDKWIRFYFDLSFNLVVSVICLNVIFGIIIDTFAQLREASSNIEEDKKNICFICGLSRYIVSLFLLTF
jgi:inositol 1,4,5-triphosphate receptor type 3